MTAFIPNTSEEQNCIKTLTGESEQWNKRKICRNLPFGFYVSV